MQTPFTVQLTAALGAAYALERELGGGGMSRVFVAFDAELQRRVAVKVLPEELAASVSVERFRREILLSAGLQHPHIVGVLSAGVAAGLPFFVMPFVEGESLAERIARDGALGVRETVSILKDVVRALAYAHERGVVHRDIKPPNILLAQGAATVTDFGVAKALSSARRSGAHDAALTITGTSLGTPLYMAPEQAAADPDVDHRADIYAVGITAYEMLAGRPPFAGMSPRAMLGARMTQDPPELATLRDDVPPPLAALVMRCLAREPALRPQSAAEILTALDDPAMVSGVFSGAERRRGGLRSRSAGLARAASALGAIAVLGVGTWSLTHRAPPAVVAPTPPAPIAPAAPHASVVVLPLVNIGRDASSTTFADGITSELAAALGRVHGVRVVSPSRAAAMLAAGRSPSEVGEALHVTMQLEGTIQRQGRRLRVTARLVDVRDGTMRWAEMYERPTGDLLAVQDELSRAITAAVRDAMATPSD